jgi:hypothetical protein
VRTVIRATSKRPMCWSADGSCSLHRPRWTEHVRVLAGTATGHPGVWPHRHERVRGAECPLGLRQLRCEPGPPHPGSADLASRLTDYRLSSPINQVAASGTDPHIESGTDGSWAPWLEASVTGPVGLVQTACDIYASWLDSNGVRHIRQLA